MCDDVKQSVYFFRCGMTRDISLISRRTGSLPLAAPAPVAEVVDFVYPLVTFDAGLLVSSSSRRRFFDTGSELEKGTRLRTWREIWLKSSM
jgi:hypothetical protein